MKLGIILETQDPEQVWNALRFATTACQRSHQVKLFLMGAAVTIDSIQTARYDVAEALTTYTTAGGEVLACGTCLKNRQLTGETSCPSSTMADCVALVEWADKTVTF